VISAEGVIPGEPVEEDGGLVLQETENLGDHLLIAAEHAVGVDDAFGHACGTGSEEDFRHGVALNFLVGVFDGASWFRRSELGEGSCFSIWWGCRRDRDFCFVRDYFFEGARVAFAIGDEDQAGIEEAERVAQLAEIARDEGIDWGNVGCGDAYVLAS
jgi:hypothetical protein